MKDFGQSLLNIWKHLGLNQRVSIIVAALGVIAVMAGIVIWSQQPDYQLLYGRLSEKDSAAIISQLQSQNIPHKIANGGSTVYVPSDYVYKMRMELASKGIPTGDGVGFEIFDKGQFGLSDFVQRTNYIRALQGELARTITQLEGVRSARVMIVQPENRLLLADQGVKPTASVFVELSKPSLNPEAVNSIRHLVANAVQGLLPDQVAVVDHKGRVLSEDLKQDPLLGTATSQMKYKQQIEDYLAKKVETMLLPVLGPGQVVVRVSAEIETEMTTVQEEKFNPEGQVIRNQSTTDDTTNSSEARSGGQPGVGANTPGGASDQAARPTNSTETNRKTQTTSFEIGRTLTNVTRNPGSIKNLSAAVFIAERSIMPTPAAGAAPAADAKPVPQPRTQEDLNALRQIVMNALGVKLVPGQNPESVVSLKEIPFTAEPVAQQIASIQNETRMQTWLAAGSRYFAVVAAVVVFFLFIRMLQKQKPETVPMELLAEAPIHAQRNTLQLNGGALTPELLNDLIRQKPVNVGTALKDWMNVKKVG